MEEKFEALAEPVMSHEARRRAIDGIWNLEKQRSVSELMKLFKADRAVCGRRNDVTDHRRKDRAVPHDRGPESPAARRRLSLHPPHHVMTHDNTRR
jgi:hypothetical protein